MRTVVRGESATRKVQAEDGIAPETRKIVSKRQESTTTLKANHTTQRKTQSHYGRLTGTRGGVEPMTFNAAKCACYPQSARTARRHERCKLRQKPLRYLQYLAKAAHEIIQGFAHHAGSMGHLSMKQPGSHHIRCGEPQGRWRPSHGHHARPGRALASAGHGRWQQPHRHPSVCDL